MKFYLLYLFYSISHCRINLFRIRMHEEKNSKNNEGDIVKEGAIPAYLLDRQEQSRSKVFHHHFFLLLDALLFTLFTC